MPVSRKCARLSDIATIIAVILILTPILACGLRRMRETSEQRVCTENLKRLGVACEMYQADWDDVLVPYGSPFGWPPNKMWYELLDAYIRKIPGGTMNGSNLPREFKCPSVPDQTGFAYERTYGMNLKCGGWVQGMPPDKIEVVRLKQVTYPQATIRIAESEWNAQGGSAFAPQPTAYVAGDPTCHRLPEWHSGKGNVLWIDGHVSAMTRDQYNMTDTGAYSGQIWLRLEGPKPAVPQ